MQTAVSQLMRMRQTRSIYVLLESRLISGAFIHNYLHKAFSFVCSGHITCPLSASRPSGMFMLRCCCYDDGFYVVV